MKSKTIYTIQTNEHRINVRTLSCTTIKKTAHIVNLIASLSKIAKQNKYDVLYDEIFIVEGDTRKRTHVLSHENLFRSFEKYNRVSIAMIKSSDFYSHKKRIDLKMTITKNELY